MPKSKLGKSKKPPKINNQEMAISISADKNTLKKPSKKNPNSSSEAKKSKSINAGKKTDSKSELKKSKTKEPKTKTVSDSKIKSVLEDVLHIIKPTEEEVHDEISFAERLVEHIAENSPQTCEVVLTGSVAKMTFLKDKKDIDIFVLFEKTVPESDLENLIKKIMENSFPGLSYQLSYAEHPYIRFTFEGHKIDLVPAYQISNASERISAVDRSVLHTAFINERLKPERIDDVLLLKSFLKSNSLYGAEIKIQGFSGYLCELLVVAFGSFKKLLEFFFESKEEQVFVDIMKYYNKSQIDATKKKFGTSLIVIDPTDKDRNVSAALSNDNFNKFKNLAGDFLSSPDKEFFFRPPMTFETKVALLKAKFKFLITLPRPNIVDDVLWGQIYKVSSQLKAALKDFSVKEVLADDSEHLIRFAIAADKEILPAKKTIFGPPLKMKKNVDDFKRSHPKAKFSQKNEKITAQIIQEPKTLEEAALDFFRNFSKNKSHLAYPEEFIVISKFASKQ